MKHERQNRFKRAKGRIQMGGRIVVFGSYVTDLTGRGTRFPVPGKRCWAHRSKWGRAAKVPIRRSPLFRAGGDVTLVTKLGRDAFGRAARDFYTAEGMNTGEWIEDETCETGAALIMVNQQSGQNMIMVLNGRMQPHHTGGCPRQADADRAGRCAARSNGNQCGCRWNM